MGYLTINPFIDDGFFDVDYLNKQKAVYENEYIRHIRFNKALIIIVEGKTNKAVIFKKEYVIPNSDDIAIEEEPLGGLK